MIELFYSNNLIKINKDRLKTHFQIFNILIPTFVLNSKYYSNYFRRQTYQRLKMSKFLAK